MSEHALLSASSSSRWLECPGSVALCKDLPDKSSSFSLHGTAMHELAEKVLTEGMPALPVSYAATNGVTLNKEDIAHVYDYVEHVRCYTGAGTLLVEQRVDYSSFIGVPNSFGTSDAIVISEDGEELTVIDLKGGRGVQIDADSNSQMMLYALGAINEFSALGNFKRVRLVISQPRLNHLSEWSCSVDELLNFAEYAKQRAALAYAAYGDGMTEGLLNPSEDSCRFCKAKATCPALSEKVMETIESGFDVVSDPIPVSTVIDDLSTKMKAIPLIEAWCKSIRAAVEAELLQGKPVAGFKLVRGKQGNRQWADKEAAEAELKAMRLRQEEIYDFSIQSPTSIEKVLKEHPRKWARVEAMITRSEGKISVASEKDKRPALDIGDVEAGFDTINNDEE